jgi:hypothetical protein
VDDTFGNRDRRTARSRFTATLAAVGALLLSSSLLVMATTPAAVANSETCDKLGYTKIDRSSGSFSAAWGDIRWSGSTLRYDIDSGYAVDFCLKSGSKSGTATYTGLTGSGSVRTGGKHQDISHIGYKVRTTPPSGPKVVTPTVVFDEPTCNRPSVVATGLVDGVRDATERQLESDSDTDDHGVTFSITSGSIAKNASVTITARAAAGYEFPGGATTKRFTHQFGDVPTNCAGGGPTTVTPEVDFTNPTCADLDGADVDVVDTTGIAYTQTGSAGLGQEVTVVAKAQPGFEFPGGATERTFTHAFPSIDDLDCVAGKEAIRPAVTFTEASCEAPNGAGLTGKFTDVVDYTVVGDIAPGESVVVTAAIKPAAADQFSFPGGFDNEFEHTFAEFDASKCVKGTQTSVPKPDEERPPTVLGTQSAVPSAVDAGLGGGSTESGSDSALLAQLVGGAAGLLLLVAAGWSGIGGRRNHGGHEV